MDNHDSHVSIETVQAALDNEIVLAGLPTHTTHILQPLDVKVRYLNLQNIILCALLLYVQNMIY